MKSGSLAQRAIPPVISPLLIAHGGDAVAVMMVAFALPSLGGVLLLRPVDGAEGQRRSEQPSTESQRR